MLDNYWSNVSDNNQSDCCANGSSLSINASGRPNPNPNPSKDMFMSEQEDKGIIKNLATVNSQQKESIRREIESNRSNMMGLGVNRIS